MPWPFRARRVRPSAGGYRIELSTEERALLTGLPQQMRELLETDHPALERLFPPAYIDDPAMESEYRGLMRDDLLAHRRSCLEVLEATAGKDHVTEEELVAWMGAINDVRLVLGTTLDVTDDGPDDVADDDPRVGSIALYHYLTMVLDEVIDVLSRGLPDGGIDDVVTR